MNELKTYEYDVFLSFTGADRELKNEIRVKLEASGLACYDSDSYCKGRFRDDYSEALDKSRVYLMILTDNLRNDPILSGKGKLTEVRRESALACELESRNELNIVILCASEFFRYENGFHDYNDVLGWHFYTHTRGFSKVYAAVEDDGTLSEKTLAEIERECREFSVARKNGKPVVSQAPRIEISNEKLAERGLFKGRERETEDVMNAFIGGKQAVLLSGMGGMGKTKLAIEVARLCEENGLFRCPQIVRVQEISGGGLAAVISSVAYEKSVYDSLSALSERERYERKLKALRDLPENVLLIIDNYNSLTKRDLNELLSKLKCKLLITTRAKLDEASNVATVNIGSLPIDNALEMFRELYGGSVDRESFLHLYDYIGGHTITLCIMAKMLVAHGMTIDGLMAEMNAQTTTGAKVEFQHNESDETDTVMGHLERLFGINEFDEEAKLVLRNMCVLSDGTIAVDDFCNALGLKNRNGINVLLKSGWLEMQMKEREYLYLHPILSRLVARMLAPSEDNVSYIIDYLIEKVNEAKESLTYKDAAYLSDKLIYACYVVAGGSSRLSTVLWEKYTEINSLLSNADDTMEKTVSLAYALSDREEKEKVVAYGDMIYVRQYPTRTDILDNYLDKLEKNSSDYKWVLRSLSVLFPHVLGVEKQREFLKRAVMKAINAAMLRCDDFALINLWVVAFTVVDKKELYPLFKDYVRKRKKEGVRTGDLLMLENYILSLNLFSANSSFELLSETADYMSGLANEKYGLLFFKLLRHPLCFFKARRMIGEVDKLPDYDPAKAYLQLLFDVTGRMVTDGLLDVRGLLLVAVGLHQRKIEEGTTLASASQAALGVLGFANRFPVEQLQNESKLLDASIDFGNISVGALSQLQVSVHLNKMLKNPEAIEQSKKMLHAIRLLRPDGHGDILSALEEHGDVCIAFGNNAEGLNAYCDVFIHLGKVAPDSMERAFIARKMLKVNKLSTLPINSIQLVYKVAKMHLVEKEWRYYSILNDYVVLLMDKLYRNELKATDEEVVSLLRELSLRSEELADLDFYGQRTLLNAIVTVVSYLISGNYFDEVDKLLISINSFKRSKKSRIRAFSQVYYNDMLSDTAIRKHESDAHLKIDRAVRTAIKYGVLPEVAKRKTHYKIMLTFGKNNFRLGDTINEGFSLFVKSKKRLKELCELKEMSKQAFMRLVASIPENDGKLDNERINEKLFADQIYTTSVKMHERGYELDVKGYIKIRSVEAFYYEILKRVLKEIQVSAESRLQRILSQN